MTLRTDDLRIIETQELSTPEEVRRELPISDTSAEIIMGSRKIIENILEERDDRIFVVIGPCSIHDPIAAMDYAKRLKKISSKLSKNLFIIMRVYFEKPRTTIGWKGLINDPMLDGSFKINEGIRIGRKLLLDIVNLNIPTGTEYLDLYGDLPIKNIYIVKKPISKYGLFLFHYFTSKKYINIKFNHISLIVDVQLNNKYTKQILIEKNNSINIDCNTIDYFSYVKLIKRRYVKCLLKKFGRH